MKKLLVIISVSMMILNVSIIKADNIEIIEDSIKDNIDNLELEGDNEVKIDREEVDEELNIIEEQEYEEEKIDISNIDNVTAPVANDFTLSDWDYTLEGDPVVLSRYNGTEVDIVIPRGNYP